MSNVKDYPLDYTLDPQIRLKDQINVVTSEGFSLSLSNIQKDPEDFATFGNTNLLLSKKDIISNSFEDISKKYRLTQSLPEQFVTYLSPVSGNSVSEPRFLSINQPSLTCEGISVTIEDISQDDLSNRHFFEIQLEPGLDGFARISHYTTSDVLYLTYNYTLGEVYFDAKGAPSLGSQSSDNCFTFTAYSDPREDPQLFEYIIDEVTGNLKLMKFGFESSPTSTVTRQKKLFIVSTSGNTLDLQPDTGTVDLENVPMFRIELPLNIRTNDLTTSVVTYSGDRLKVSDKVRDTKHNILLHSEYKDSNSNSVNAILLKNQLPNTFEQTKNNLIPGSNATDYRDYTTIISEANQSDMKSLPSMVYTDHTAEITLPANQLTYFHLPHEMYPYKKLYIGDAGLISSGAVFGDSPTTSDKIFKKKADYSQSTPYGDPLDEHTGTWACSWLYSPTSKPEDCIWVDRYYDPVTYSWSHALSTNVTTIYETLIDQKNAAKFDTYRKGIFDVKSTLMLEPATYYAYHHIGTKDITENIAKTLKSNTIIDEFREINLDSNIRYSIPSNIDSEAGFNISFTLSKSIDASWEDKIGYHILGNYSNTGFSIFNDMSYDPLIYALTEEEDYLKIYDINYSEIAIVGIEAPDPDDITKKLSTTIVDYTVIESLGNIYCIRKDKTVSNPRYFLYEYNTDGAIVELTKLPEVNREDKVTFTSSHVAIAKTSEIVYIDLLTEKITKNTRQDINSVYMDDSTGDIYTADDIYIRGKYDVYATYTDSDGDVYSDIVFSLLPTSSIDTAHIKSAARDSLGNAYIIFKDQCEGLLADYLISFNAKNELRYITTIDELSDVPFIDNDVDSTYELYTMSDTNESLGKESIHIIRSLPGQASRRYILNSKGEAVSTRTVKDKLIQVKTFSGKYSANNTLIFKHKLHNIVDRDDINIVKLDLDIGNIFNNNSHHICYDFNPKASLISIYVDGEIVKETIIDSGSPGKYTFTDFHRDDIRVGDIPYLNNTSFLDLLNTGTRPVNLDFKISDLKMFNKSLSPYNVRHISTATGEVDDMIWTVPYTKRHFTDSISQVQKHALPGVKSNNITADIYSNIFINSDLKDDIISRVKMQLDEFIPGNVNLTDITWNSSSHNMSVLGNTLPASSLDDCSTCAILPTRIDEQCSYYLNITGLHIDIDGVYTATDVYNNKPLYTCSALPSTGSCNTTYLNITGLHIDIDGVYTATDVYNNKPLYTSEL